MPRRSKQEEIEILFPEQEVQLSTGIKVIVSPFMLRDFEKVSGLVSKYQQLFTEEAPKDKTQKLSTFGFFTNADAIADAIELIGYCCDFADFDSLRFDDFGELFFAAVEVNSNFLLARVQRTLMTFRAMSNLAGETLSPLSSLPDTNGATLEDIAKIS